MAEFSRKAHARGGVIDSENATSLELPAIVACGAVDVVGLANNHFWRSDCYTGRRGAWPDHLLRRYPESCSGFALAGFEV